MKSEVLKIVLKEFIHAEDNLRRATYAFGNLSESELKCAYGASGKTKGETLNGHQSRRTKLAGCIEWVKKQKESN